MPLLPLLLLVAVAVAIVVSRRPRRLRRRVINFDFHPTTTVLLLLQVQLIIIILNHNHDLAPLDRPRALPPTSHLRNLRLAFPAQRQDARAHRAYLLFEPAHDLLALYADRLGVASGFFALAARLDLFPRFARPDAAAAAAIRRE
jgi:hypothetical protein